MLGVIFFDSTGKEDIQTMKKMILVTSPPACGKTYISKQLAKELKHVVYLDKDTVIPLSNRVFKAGGQEINRSSDFFEENIRDYEYEVTVNFGLEALEYDDIVLINAPFTREVHDEKFLKNFSKKLADHGAKLVVIWVVTKPEICHQRMIDRNSVRDTWKLEHWDEYVKTIDYSIPEALKKMSSCLDLMLFYNSSDERKKRILPDLIFTVCKILFLFIETIFTSDTKDNPPLPPTAPRKRRELRTHSYIRARQSGRAIFPSA